jgi:hypothetical protein
LTADVGEQVTDAELAARFRRDPELLTAVYDRYIRDIHRYVAGRLDAQAAEDLTAEWTNQPLRGSSGTAEFGRCGSRAAVRRGRRSPVRRTTGPCSPTRPPDARPTAATGAAPP